MLSAITVGLVACSPKDSSVKIGHVAPLTGAIAHLGKDNEAGAKLAIADLNKAGIKIGAAPSRSPCYPKMMGPTRSKAPLPHRNWSTLKSPV